MLELVEFKMKFVFQKASVLKKPKIDQCTRTRVISMPSFHSGSKNHTRCK